MSIAKCKATLRLKLLLCKMSNENIGWAGATPSPIPVACMKTEYYNLNVSVIWLQYILLWGYDQWGMKA